MFAGWHANQWFDILIPKNSSCSALMRSIYPLFISVPTYFLHNSHLFGYMHVRRHNSVRAGWRRWSTSTSVATKYQLTSFIHPSKSPLHHIRQRTHVKEPYNPSKSPTLRQRALHITSAKEPMSKSPYNPWCVGWIWAQNITSAQEPISKSPIVRQKAQNSTSAKESYT